MDQIEKLRKNTITLLKSILIPKAKVGVPIHLLCYEYEEQCYEPLKFREMGYGTLQQFISDNSDTLYTTRGPDGHVYVKAKADENTAHIHKMVVGQKTKTKKKSKKSVVFPTKRVPVPLRGRPSFSFMTNRNANGFRPVNPAFRTKNTRMSNNLPPRFKNQRTNKVVSTANSIHSKPDSNHQQKRPTNVNQSTKPKFSFNQNSINTPSTSATIHVTQPSNSLNQQFPLVSDLQTIERTLKELLKGRSNGILATRLRPFYGSIYQQNLPENIKQIITERFSHFVQIESTIQNHEILYYKEPIPKTPNAPLPSPGFTPIHDEKQANITQLSAMNISRTPTAAASSTMIDSVEQVHTAPNDRMESLSSTLQINSLDLPEVGDKLHVYVCHVESLDRFFVQLQDSTIQDLVQQMQDFYNDPLSADLSIVKPKVGEYCCARFTQDKLWFRAKTLSVKEQRNMVNASYRCHVFYPDYGNDEYVLSTELKPLTEEFCELPFQAIQCCLNNLIAAEGGGWSEQVIQFFQHLTEDVELVMKVIENNGNVLSVDLSDANGQSVSQHLIDQGYAKERIPTINQLNSSSNSRLSLSRTLSLEPTDNTVKGSWVKIPDSEYIDICVTHIVSSCLVYAKIVGSDYHEKLEALEIAINNNFENASVKPASRLDIGEYYIALCDDEWKRAQLIGITDADDCEILLVDSGVKTVVSKEDMKNIQSKFLRLPFQAFQCQLKGVPESNDPEILQYMTEALLGKANLGLIYSRDERELKTKVTLGIYDQFSDSTDINLMVIEKIEAEKKLVPKLPEIGEEGCPGFVTHVSEEGEFYVQIFGPGLDRLETLTKDISSHFTQCSRATEIIARPEVGQICCAKCPQSANWYRAQVKQVFQQERKVEVEFIDYGNREIINMVLIRKPLAVSESVITLPFQAVKVKMDGVKQLSLHEEAMYDKLKDFIYNMGGVLVKIQVVGKENDLSVVRLTIPTEEDENDGGKCIDFCESFQEYLNMDGLIDDGDGLVSDTINNNNDTMNTTFENISLYSKTIDQSNTTLSEWDVISSTNSPEKICNKKQQQQLSDIKEEEQRSSSGFSSSSSASLRSPRCVTPAVTFSQHWGMPEMKLSDQFVAGIVQDASDPSKFTIMPFDQWDLLEAMHKDMAVFYNHNESHALRDISSLSIGDVCVVYNVSQEVWYRAVIHAVVDDKMVVKFPDFSSLPELVSCNNIRILTDQFKQLPFLSIRCSLYGIEPVSTNSWSKEAKDVFSAMVVDETFQVEIMSDTADRSKPVLVTLHGNQGGNHYIVNNKLVTMGYAKRISVCKQ